MNKKIIGHKKEIELLERMMKNGSLHQSFLFAGPESVGKQVIARAFANKIVNNDVESELNLNNRIDSDIDIVVPQKIQKKKKIIIKNISVDEIVDAAQSMALAPDKNAKVLIINDAHKMTIEAQNALLKTLEEPRNNRYIILITHSVNDLLRTIQSRCFTLHFGSVNKNELCKVYGESEYINDVNGCPGFLHKIYHDDEFRKIIECARSELQILAKRNLHERLKLALELSKKDDVYLQAFFQVWIYRIWTAAHKTKKFQLIKVADKIEKTLNKMNSTNVNKQLVLEDLLIKIV